jgi:hypothetical protein
MQYIDHNRKHLRRTNGVGRITAIVKERNVDSCCLCQAVYRSFCHPLKVESSAASDEVTVDYDVFRMVLSDVSRCVVW